MPSLSPATDLTITNPLVLYRTLVATKQIKPDAAQHRLAIHLQKLYLRLKDYSPEVNYRDRLDQLSRAIGSPWTSPEPVEASDHNAKPESIFSSLRTRKQNKDALALTKRLTDHESVVNIQSPQGLLLHGEVGTGKSMLVDLLADCLPNQKKRRWHFNTFMLETFARLEQLRRKRLDSRSLAPHGAVQDEEHSLLCLARDMISTSPILFLDEFQLPDRAASKILSTLFTSFFQLGGVLIATSNRMPEELANASGVEFAAPPSTRLGWLGNRWGLLAAGSVNRKSENVFPLKGDFAAFLEVLRARCEVWDIEGKKDWRRRETEVEDNADLETDGINESLGKEACLDGLEPIKPANIGPGYGQSKSIESGEESTGKGAKDEPALPTHYFVTPRDVAESVDDRWGDGLASIRFQYSKSSHHWLGDTMGDHFYPHLRPQRDCSVSPLRRDQMELPPTLRHQPRSRRLHLPSLHLPHLHPHRYPHPDPAPEKRSASVHHPPRRLVRSPLQTSDPRRSRPGPHLLPRNRAAAKLQPSRTRPLFSRLHLRTR